MNAHFNRLTPAQAERLALLAEEAGEVVQIVGKILRHGYDSHHPKRPEDGTNRSMLEREIGDITLIMDLMLAKDDISRDACERAFSLKYERMRPYLHHQEDPT